MNVSDSKLYLQKVHRVRGEFPRDEYEPSRNVTLPFSFHDVKTRGNNRQAIGAPMRILA
jgi:hypothetical protein